MNLVLHGIEDFQIVREDTLRNPAFTDSSTGGLATFDCVIANPPFSLKEWGREIWEADPCGRADFGLPPESYGVTFDRESCLRYKKALDEHLPAEASDIVMTVNSGETDYAPYNRDRDAEEKLLDRFREAFSMHTGLMLRLTDKDFEQSEIAPEDIGYDAFISHASEDKAALVRQLATALEKMGFRVWYDEFELRVGDSLRQSIDRGLVNSRYGIVVLSPAFFAKNWPQYELNGLMAREMEGHKVILPVWHNVTKRDVLHFSPPLADKVAAVTKNRSIKAVATDLAHALDE